MGNAFFFESRKLNGNSIESLEKLRRGSLTANYLQIACKQPVKNLEKNYTDQAAIEDEGLKSVAEFVQPKWLAQMAQMGYHFVPWLN